MFMINIFGLFFDLDLPFEIVLQYDVHMCVDVMNAYGDFCHRGFHKAFLYVFIINSYHPFRVRSAFSGVRGGCKV